jgi:hypothetical protein
MREGNRVCLSSLADGSQRVQLERPLFKLTHYRRTGTLSAHSRGGKLSLLNYASKLFEIIDKAMMFEAAGFVIGSSQN